MIEGIKNFFKRADIFLLLLCIIVNLFGLVLVYSATRFNATYPPPTPQTGGRHGPSASGSLSSAIILTWRF